MEKRVWRELAIGPRNRLKRWNRAGRPHSCLACQHEKQSTSGSEGQAVWQGVAFSGTSEDYVLGGMLLHRGEAKEVATGIERVAQLQRHRFPTTPRRRLTVESGSVAPVYAQRKPLSPLPPTDGPQVIRKKEWC